MQVTSVLESLFRWAHVVAGILWIGLLYFFNWVNSAFAPTMDGDTKKKVVPELLPRALFWFRWGAAWTWFTGVLLLALVFYHGGILFESPNSWGPAAYAMIAVTFLAVFLYDALMKTLGKSNMMAAVVVGLILVAAAIWLMGNWAGFSYRGYVIHIGAMFGSMMAFNVWYRIWPAQQKIIRAIKNGESPDPALVGLAGMRSKHNTYMSIPLVWMMVNSHTTWAASRWWYLVGAIVIGWWIGSMLFRKAPKVPGF
ncbi:MAG: urate hydroxylase PuuD [Candidatus Latescibacterota bacterium]|nr:MAG: urate hydroxylase PuuD [Candidatus Latescibacterota bacterium]